MTYRPTKRALALGLGALVLFGVGTNVQAGWVLAVAALLGGTLLVGLVAPVRGLREVEVSRLVPRTAVAGQDVPVTLEVSNTGRRLRAAIGVFDDFCGAGAAVAGILRPGERRGFTGRRAGARRGVHGGGPCTLECGSPFGVALVRRTIEVRSPIVVYPRTYPTLVRAMVGVSSWRAASPFGDTSTVRDYRRGDSLRHVHWRSSARRGELMVREFDAERRADVVVTAEGADGETGDAVASVACSLALGFREGGSEVQLLAAREGSVHAVAARSAEAVLEWGARLGPDRMPFARVVASAGASHATVCVAPALTRAVEALFARAASGPTLVVLVGRPEAASAAAGRVRAAGAEVAVVGESEVEAWFASGSIAS